LELQCFYRRAFSIEVVSMDTQMFGASFASFA